MCNLLLSWTHLDAAIVANVIQLLSLSHLREKRNDDNADGSNKNNRVIASFMGARNTSQPLPYFYNFVVASFSLALLFYLNSQSALTLIFCVCHINDNKLHKGI